MEGTALAHPHVDRTRGRVRRRRRPGQVATALGAVVVVDLVYVTVELLLR